MFQIEGREKALRLHDVHGYLPTIPQSTAQPGWDYEETGGLNLRSMEPLGTESIAMRSVAKKIIEIL